MLDVITRRGDLELTLQIGAEILGSEDPRNRGDHPDFYSFCTVRMLSVHHVTSRVK